MNRLTQLQRDLLVRRLEREIGWQHDLAQYERDNAHRMAVGLVEAMEWTGRHGASEKRAVELIIAKLDQETA